MKIFIIILFILIILYIIRKKEDFAGKKVLEYDITPEMIEDIKDTEDGGLNNTISGKRYITYKDYCTIENIKNKILFKKILSQKEVGVDIFERDTGFFNNIGIYPRNKLLSSIFNSKNSEQIYYHYLDFKRGNVYSGDETDDKYKNPNNIDYATLFIETFEPNIILNTKFIKPDKEIRIRYQIKKTGDNQIIYSNYINYDTRGVEKLDDGIIQLQRSPMSFMYEPYEEILLGSQKFLYPYKRESDEASPSNKIYSNHFLNLQKLVIDIKDAQTEESLKTIENDYENNTDKYLYAFEDYNKINKSVTEYCIDNYTDNCVVTETRLFLSPGDYTMDIILDLEDDLEDYSDDFSVSLKYNLNDSKLSNPDDLIITDNEKLNSFNNNSKFDTSSYLDINITGIISDLNSLESYIKKTEQDEQGGNEKITWLFNDNFNKNKPVYFTKYVKIYLFLIVLKFKIITDVTTKKNDYIKLMKELEIFIVKYKSKRADLRVISNPSKKYLDLTKELNLIAYKVTKTENDNSMIGQILKVMDDMKEEELERSEGKLGIDTKKIKNLRMFSEQIYDKSSKITEITNLITNVKNDTNFPITNTRMSVIRLIDIYIHTALKTAGDNTLNNYNIYSFSINQYKLKDYFINFRTKLEKLKTDREGKIKYDIEPGKILNNKFPISKNSSFDFTVLMKPIFSPAVEFPEYEIDIEKAPELKPEISEYTALLRRILRLIKRDFNGIIKDKNYEYLSPDLELILKNIYKSSNSSTTDKKRVYNDIINIIIDLVAKLKDGSVDSVNYLLNLDIDTYVYTPRENFSNYNTMNPDIIEHFDSSLHKVEHFDSSLHKHTSEGRINFDLQWGNPLLKDNEGRYDEYTLLSDQSKSQVMDSYNKMETVLNKASSIVNKHIVGMDNKIKNIDERKVAIDTDRAMEQIEKTQEELDQDYKEKELLQNEKLNSISVKVKELEKLQNKKYLSDSKEFNSIKSFGDGQVMSIKNMKDDIYNVLVNGECLSYNKKGNLDIKPCNYSKNQQYQIRTIPNMDKYNDVIIKNNQEPVGEYDGVNYPFQMLNPILHQSQCLTLNGNSVGVKECLNSNKQRWEGIKNIKICDKD